MHLGEACDGGKAVHTEGSLSALAPLALKAITFSPGLLGFRVRPPGCLQSLSGLWGAPGASGAQRCTGEKGDPARSSRELGREDRV